jgi:hypothetical protein
MEPTVASWRMTNQGALLDVDALLNSELPGKVGERPALPVGAAADDRDGGPRRVAPEVIALPPDHLAEQVWFQAAAQRRARQHRELDLLVLPDPELAFGRVSLQQPLRPNRVLAADARAIERADGKGHEDLAQERVVRTMQHGNRGGEAERVIALREPGQDAPERLATILGGRTLPGHTPTYAQHLRYRGRVQCPAFWRPVGRVPGSERASDPIIRFPLRPGRRSASERAAGNLTDPRFRTADRAARGVYGLYELPKRRCGDI